MSTPGLLPALPGEARLTPAQQAEIGAAQTMPIGAAPAELMSKLSAATTPGGSAVTAPSGFDDAVARPVGGSRAKMLGGVGAVVVVAVVAAVVVLRGSEKEDPAGAAASAAVAPPPSSVATAIASASTSAGAAPVADEVKLTIQSKPPGVAVYVGDSDEELGTAPGPLLLKRGDQPVTLTFKAPGYASNRVDVTPSGDMIVPVKLEPAAPGAPGKVQKPGGKDVPEKPGKEPKPAGSKDVAW
jgi:hypothetical protein